MLEKWPNCKENHILFSNRWAKKTDADKVAHQSRIIELAWRTSPKTATDTALRMMRMLLGHRLKGTTKDQGRNKEELVDSE
jgi:hypothetical protein